jgi:hypothetical protein
MSRYSRTSEAEAEVRKKVMRYLGAISSRLGDIGDTYRTLYESARTLKENHPVGWTDPGNIKGGSITVPWTSCLTGLDKSVLQIKTKIVSCHTVDSKPVKQ